MLYIVAFLLLVGFLMIPHEWGHYIAARRAGMKVYEYSIGIGPAIFSRVCDGVRFSLRPIPIAAYVRIAGMEPSEADHPEGFASKSIPWRFLVLIAGSTMNILVALIVFIAVGMTYGKIVGSSSLIRDVSPQMPAYRVGIRAGDRIVAVNAKRTTNVKEIQKIIHSLPNKPVTVMVLREGKERVFRVTPKAISYFEREADTGKKVKKTIGMIGIAFTPVYKRVGALESVEDGFVTTGEWIATIVYSIGVVLTSKDGLKVIGGPVAIAREAGESAKRGPREYFQLVGIISVNLAIFNLLPFLMLDGGRIMFLLYEAVRGKKIDPKKEFIANAIGMAFLLALAIVITAKDIRDLLMK